MPSPLSHNSPERVIAYLDEFPCTAWLSSINGHALLKERRHPTDTKPEKW